MLMRDCLLANTSTSNASTNSCTTSTTTGHRRGISANSSRRSCIRNNNKSRSNIITIAISVGSAAIHFWLLTQAANAQQLQPHSANGNSRLHLTTTITADAAQMRDQRDAAAAANDVNVAAAHAVKDNAALHRCHRPVCVASNNGHDHVLFASACLLEETNRERYLGATVFREIALSACRPDCNVICSRSRSSGSNSGSNGAVDEQRPLCALDTRSGRMLSFSSDCAYARHVCLSDSEWTLVDEGLCATALPQSADATTTTPATMMTTVAPLPAATTFKPTSSSTDARSYYSKGAPARHKKPRKSIPCPKVFNPVCATHAGVRSTFINECLVNAENVKTGADWQIFSTGVCAEDYASSVRHAAINNQNTVQRRRRAFRNDAFAYAPLAAELDALGEDVIWAPPVVHTEYVDDDVDAVVPHMQQQRLQRSPQHLQSAAKPTYANESATWSTSSLPMLYTAQTSLPIHIIGVVDDKVRVCKFGAASVCGRAAGFERTFGNICELMLHNIMRNQTWTVLHEGACKTCVLNCTMEFEPVCVSRNGLNYTIINECYLNYGVCQDKRSTWRVLSRGECPGTRVKQPIVDKYVDSEPGFRYTSSYGTTTAAPTTLQAISTTTTATTTTYSALPYAITQATTTEAPITTTPAAYTTTTAPVITAATRPPTTSTTAAPLPSAISSKSCPFQLPVTSDVKRPISPPTLWLYPPIINTARFLIGANGWPYLVSSSSTYGGARSDCAQNKGKCAPVAPEVPKLKRGVSQAPSKRTHIMNLMRPKCRCSRKSAKSTASSKSDKKRE